MMIQWWRDFYQCLVLRMARWRLSIGIKTQVHSEKFPSHSSESRFERGNTYRDNGFSQTFGIIQTDSGIGPTEKKTRTKCPTTL